MESEKSIQNQAPNITLARAKYRFSLMWRPAFIISLLSGMGMGSFYLTQRLIYEFKGPVTWDSPLYLAVGRGILNGLTPYNQLYENKPPGIFLLSSLSIWLTGGYRLVTLINVAMIATFPLLIVWGSFIVARSTSFRKKIFTFLLSLLFGILMVLYMAERSGEFQVELFGAYLTTLYVLTILGHNFSRRKFMAATVLLLCATAIKEPFLIVALASALLLYADNLHAFWQRFVRPAFFAGMVGLILLIVTGYAGAYLSIYLPEMLFRHIGAGSSPFMRALDWNRLYFDLRDYQPQLGVTILSLIGASFIGRLLQWKPWTFLRQAICMLLGIYLIAFTVGMGGQYYNHHFVFAVPGYAVLFLMFLEMSPETRRWFSRLSFQLIAVLMAVTLVRMPTSNYGERIKGIKDDEAFAKKAAASIDEILTDCRIPSYLFLGANGIDVFGYTNHSPMGPNFYQYNNLVDSDHEFFKDSFLSNLKKADLVVLRELTMAENIKQLTDKYLHEDFTTQPWNCAQKSDPTVKYTFFFRHRKDLPGKEPAAFEIAQNQPR